MDNKKYELLTNDTIELNGKILYRIKALKDFSNVKAGDLGGYIEKEENLSHEGNCWVSGNAKVYDNAIVYCNAYVYGNAKVRNNAQVFGNAKVYDNAKVFDKAWVHGSARVYGDARVFDSAYIHDNSRVYGNAEVFGNAWVCSIADISSRDHILWISNMGSRNNDTITFMRNSENEILVNTEFYTGTISKFKQRVSEVHGDNKYAKEYLVAIELATIKIEL